MKIIFLLLSFVFINEAISQIDKGQFLIGGNISFASQKQERTGVANYQNTTFIVSPNIGYFVVPKLAAGLRLNVAIFKDKGTTDFSQTFVSLSPYLRYYFLKQNQKINILADAGYINYKTKVKSPSFEPYTERTEGYRITAGPAVFLNQHIALEFLVSYAHTITSNPFDNPQETIFETGLGLQIHLGKIKNKSKK